MGDPKKRRKKYETPFRPWDEERIKEERGLVKEYGLKNKREIWKLSSLLRKFKVQARKLIASTSKQAELEKKQLIGRLIKLGLVSEDAKVSAILELKLMDLLEKRLQTQVYKQGFANSAKQSRQFIVHRHIAIDGKIVDAPSRLVLTGEKIEFKPTSKLSDAEHIERSKINKAVGIKEAGSKVSKIKKVDVEKVNGKEILADGVANKIVDNIVAEVSA